MFQLLLPIFTACACKLISKLKTHMCTLQKRTTVDEKMNKNCIHYVLVGNSNEKFIKLSSIATLSSKITQIIKIGKKIFKKTPRRQTSDYARASQI